MQARGFWLLGEVSDDGLVDELKALLAAGCRVEARVVAHLAELDARRLQSRQGCSLYEYCSKHLGLSESQAFYRIVAARAARRFPIIFEMLERGEVHLTTL